MGLFGGNKNKCEYKDQCPIAGMDGTCSYSRSGGNYEDCDIYKDWA